MARDAAADAEKIARLSPLNIRNQWSTYCAWSGRGSLVMSSVQHIVAAPISTSISSKA